MTSILVKDTETAKGRGVFALRAFSEGEVVEICPVMVLATPYADLPADIKTIVFQWLAVDGEPTNRATQAIAFGCGSLYNHDNPSNMRFVLDRPALVIRFFADRDITPGEELTINYSSSNGETTTENDWWFEQKNIELVT